MIFLENTEPDSRDYDCLCNFWFSHQPAEESTVASDGLSYLLLRAAGKIKMIDITGVDLEKMCQLMATPVRKSAHAIEFAALDAALLFALRFRNMRGWQWMKTALIMTVIYACSDEFHQLFIPGRAGMVTDVLVDSTGAMLITVGVSLLCAACRKIKHADSTNHLTCRREVK